MAGDGAATTASLEQYHDTLDTLVIRTTLLSTLSGVVVAMSVVSFVLLWRRDLRQRAVQALLAATTMLTISTALFFAVSIVAAFATDDIMYQQSAGLTASPARARLVYAMTLTVFNTLGFNAAVGDAVVIWRAVALWGYARWAIIIAGVLNLATLVSGFVALAYGASIYRAASRGAVPVPFHLPEFLDIRAGLAGVLFSLLTNVVATALISAKTWIHWQSVRRGLARRRGLPRTFHLLLLLIETGIAYSLCWVFIAVFFGVHIAHDVGTPGLFDVAGRVFILSCIVPLIAVYPMALIAIFAAKQSTLQEATRFSTGPISLHTLSHASHDDVSVDRADDKIGNESEGSIVTR
ncbi:uncharacterized protein BXZ73DRAFT_76356 [Epithele typhae]|uniref:uncharacterized protein n=1 Tax=Epithele typhae TaxID=378194 RepID=UPI0020080CBB|nr:uncharacterized protein BXZ73DRAFT_76356 [Epithele typhae]KAH9938854.1 hypothetical protein BXZ73DRAFT_76356 [Epithele typhae]